MVDLNHHSRLEHSEAAFAALGKRVAVAVQNAG